MRNGALVLSVNSRERAERAMEARSGLAPDDPATPPQEAVHIMHSWLNDHDRRTLDEPLSMLDGKTLREAPATREGHAPVVDWLKELKNTEMDLVVGPVRSTKAGA